jgi:hypothetical protein
MEICHQEERLGSAKSLGRTRGLARTLKSPKACAIPKTRYSVGKNSTSAGGGTRFVGV